MADKEINLDDALAETLDEIEEKDNEASTRDVESAEKDSPDLSEAEGSDEGEDDSEGDDSDGDEGEDGDEDAEDDSQEELDLDDEESDEQDEEVEPRLKLPPTTWTAEAKEKYDSLPAWAKKEIHKREEDSLRGVTSLKKQAEFGQQLNDVITPYKPMLDSLGATPENVVKDALTLRYVMASGNESQKVDVIKSLAQQAGVDISALGTDDPEQAKIQQYLSPLQQEIQRLNQQLHGQQQHSQQRQVQEAQSQIQEFVTKTDENGNPAYPYFDRVQEDMAILIEQGRATTLQDAYDKATWADPDIRKVLQTEQSAKADAERQDKAAKRKSRAEKANKANLPQKGRREHAKAEPVGSIDDTMNEVLDDLTS